MKSKVQQIPMYKIIYRQILGIFRVANPKISTLVISSFFVLTASFVQACGIGLVVPVLNGLIDKSYFSGTLTIPVLGNIIKSLPMELSNANIFIFMMLMISVAVYIENIALYISNILVSRFSLNVNNIIKIKIFKRYLEFAKIFHDKQRSGELTAILYGTTMAASSIFTQLNNIFITTSMAATFLIIMLLISWRLTIFIFFLLLIGSYITRIITKKIISSSTESFKENVKMSSHSWNILSNIPLVKLYVTEEKEAGKFEIITNEAMRHDFNVQKKQFAIPRLIDIIDSTGIVIVVSITAFMMVKMKSFSLGRFFVYFIILKRFMTCTSQLNQAWSFIANLIPQIDRMLWVFDDSDKVFTKSGNVKFDGVKDEIMFKDVHFRYTKNIPVLKGINFEVKKNSMIAIIGPTGAGKTTIVNLLPRFYDCESGSVMINGLDIKEFDVKSLRKKLGMVSQDVMIMSDTIRNNIIYGLDENDVNEERLDSAARDAHIYDFIMSLPDKYETFVGERGIRLSGGEKQRVSIARAILKKPDILILDEATSSLDSETEDLIHKAIENVIKNKTVFVIAHRLSTIRNANHIIVLEEGQITEEGTLHELLDKKGRFYYYWNLQNLFY